MKSKTRFLALSLILAACFTRPGPAISAQDRGLAVVAREAAGSPVFDAGKQYAVIIGIDRYTDWPPLKNAVADAKDIRSILAERYFIDEFLELYDAAATNRGIRQLLSVDLPAKLKPQDSLLVFYAGHGYLDSAKTGSWIPVDGGSDIIGQERWIPNATLRNYLSALKVQRLLVVADSCFSGDLLSTGGRGASPTIDSAYFRKALGLTSRQVLTSGTSETVPDESEFARQLKSTLSHNAEPYLDPVMMYERIRKGVTATLPLFGTLPGHESGASFVLFLKDRGQTPASAALTSGTQAPRPESTGKMEVTRPTGSLKVQVASAARIRVDGIDKGELPAGGIGAIGGIEVGLRTIEALYSDGRTESQKATITIGATASVLFSKVPEVLKNSLGLAMVPVEGGTFMMGNQYGGESQRPAHEVRLSPFSISSTEVTVAAFTRFLSDKDPKGGRYTGAVPDETAAWGIDWYEAVDFCIWLSAKEGLQPPYARADKTVLFDPSRTGYRLPTEAEWEYAARGGQRSAGTKFAGSANAEEVAWYANVFSDSEDPPRPVAGKKPNELGLYDMNGNVVEWCWDRFGKYEPTVGNDPQGPHEGRSRVLRGFDDKELSYRGSFELGKEFRRTFKTGFRVVRSAPATRADQMVADAAIGATGVSEGSLTVDSGKPVLLKQRSGWSATASPGAHTLAFTYPDGSVKSVKVEVGAMEAATVDFGYKPGNSGIKPILVEGGSFTLGSSALTGENYARPARKVAVKSFSISEAEITRKQYRLVMEYDPSWHDRNDNSKDSYPVESVGWGSCLRFCNALSVLDGLEPAYAIGKESVKLIPGAKGWRLPSEAEWEFAAMGGLKSKGYAYSGSNDPNEVAGDNNGYFFNIQTVKLKKPNELGLYDMSGNVAEWVWDTGFKDSKHNFRYPDKPYTVPEVLKFYDYAYGDSARVFRGANNGAHAPEIRVKYRYLSYGDGDDNDGFIGFRIARSGP